MSKRKLFIAVAILFVTFLVVGIFWGVHKCSENKTYFKVSDTLENGNGKKAKVIILAGQSNASGCSLNEYLEMNLPQDEYLEYENGYDNIYINYFVSGNNISNGFVRTSTTHGENENHFGPEVGLAAKLHEMYPNELFFIIKYAYGGTNLYEEWLSPSSEGKTGHLYTGLVRDSMRYLDSKGYDAKIEGICWMQGESDSFSTENATNYETHLANFIKDIRNDLSKYASSDGIAFVDAYIAANPSYWVYYELANTSKQKVAALSDMNVVIDTNAQGLRVDQEPDGAPDMAHYDSLSQLKLGNLFAEQVSLFF